MPTDISLTNNTGYVSLYTASGNYTLTSSNSLYLSWPRTGASSYTIYINTENDSSTATESTATEVSATSYGISLYNSGTKKYLVYNLDISSGCCYYFWVKAIVDGKESDFSEPVSYIQELTASSINTLLKTKLGAQGVCTAFKPSSTPPSDSVTTYVINYATNALAWAEDATIYYYAAGYTDSGVGIPLPANCASLFDSCQTLTSIDMTGFDTSEVTSMKKMFYKCEKLQTLNVSTFDTSKVTDMSWMFYDCEKLAEIDVSSFDTANVTDMSYMFRGMQSASVINLNNFDTSNVINMESMFAFCYGALIEIDISSFDVSNVTNMTEMFYYCRKLTTIYSASNADWKSYTATSVNMFSNCDRLIGGNGTAYNSDNVTTSYAHVDTADNPGYFTAK